jgi:hypothetical protein
VSEIPELSVQSILNATSSHPLLESSIICSPVDQFDPRRAPHHCQKATASHSETPFPISIGIKAGNGETINLSDPTQRQLLGEEQKAQAKEQIMAMQEQMKNLMASWN